MITCTGCGKKNDDESLLCSKCGRKLQSSRDSVVPEFTPKPPLTHLSEGEMAAEKGRMFRRLVEAWGYIAIFAVVVAACIYFKEWWPLYPTVAVLAVALWVRRI